MRRRSSILLVATMAVLCFVGSAAQAVGTVDFELVDYLDGTFELYASASLGDNAGISYYNVDLVGILTATHQSPKAVDLGSGNTRGFTVGRGDLAGPGPLFAGQDPSSGTTNSLIYGIGQTAGSFPILPFPADVGVPWAAPVLIATGTYSLNPGSPDFGQEVFANVFTVQGELDADPAAVTTHRTEIPEPVTLSILALGAGLALLRRKR